MPARPFLVQPQIQESAVNIQCSLIHDGIQKMFVDHIEFTHQQKHYFIFKKTN